jgi:hypothetical protein
VLTSESITVVAREQLYGDVSSATREHAITGNVFYAVRAATVLRGLVVHLWLSQLRVAVVRSEKLIVEGGDSSGT